ncbi:MAG: SDR family oxidoreductase [Spiribacter salinus]|uniref:SDR family oxidoreductase n=1 Tax=Spiribacter salinus TaxID=1335746 RepID=A0A540VV41_9GAMM|nr:MAG: SDR family oxidoreductase [Spiribacter salinus]
MNEFSGRTVLISGAANPIGIGRATAEAFAREGANLALLDVDAEGLKTTAAAVHALGANAITTVCNVAKTNEVARAIAETRTNFGMVDVVICNAGIARRRPFLELTKSQLNEVMSVNFGGSCNLIQGALPDLIVRGGSVVCISSIAGSPWGWRRHADYSASKAAIEGMVRALAAEFAPQGVRMNAIAPGAIRTGQTTDAINSVGEEGLAALASQVPLQRIGDPADIADVALFLAGHRARYITGQTLVVDGGVTLGALD